MKKPKLSKGTFYSVFNERESFSYLEKRIKKSNHKCERNLYIPQTIPSAIRVNERIPIDLPRDDSIISFKDSQ